MIENERSCFSFYEHNRDTDSWDTAIKDSFLFSLKMKKDITFFYKFALTSNNPIILS
jgi:hypothetical protein